MSFNIEVQGGSSVRLPTAGKYCDRDIIVTATGGGGYTQEELDQAVADATEAGKQAENDRFWDAYLADGNYNKAFSHAKWNDETYNPNQTIVCTDGAAEMYRNATITSTKVPIEFRVADIGMAFYNCKQLKTVPKIGFFGVTSSGSLFGNCTSLEDVTFDGEITTGIGFANSSELTNASVQSLIDHLADMTGQTAPKLTFHATVGGKLTEEQKATITAKNWTLVY